MSSVPSSPQSPAPALSGSVSSFVSSMWSSMTSLPSLGSPTPAPSTHQPISSTTSPSRDVPSSVSKKTTPISPSPSSSGSTILDFLSGSSQPHPSQSQPSQSQHPQISNPGLERSSSISSSTILEKSPSATIYTPPKKKILFVLTSPAETPSPLSPEHPLHPLTNKYEIDFITPDDFGKNVIALGQYVAVIFDMHPRPISQIAEMIPTKTLQHSKFEVIMERFVSMTVGSR